MNNSFLFSMALSIIFAIATILQNANAGDQHINIISSDNPDLKEIVTIGIGSNFESAIRNAAENALMQVVGTFIDAQNQLEKHFGNY